ncbi:LysR family transcriptional regulator [Paraburkholderia ginsengiterrae]|uniref:LysR family transcriptional regulator n=1 Tax=Paraburkholderia ginsengiterrae TaxID=1462993 RepID=A0A1A9N404_9BURK|nr:LysR family transcriptional regulator [Paraburkholderia ginsengiterrae]OAJ53235.1 LysR family transcriptional regulator [Paraburkholderia ginsengiterrae]OAJ56698.1 LysR family transcriptional regulator [Paraburkholderia ginsengiterrae]
MDRLRAFEVFVTVVNRGSFARAADALDTSPANVTRYVNELEAHLGTRLLNRTSRKLSLTEGGETLYARCSTILEDVAETEGLVSTTSIEPRGRLRINAPVTFGILHLAPLWPQFMQKYPDVELEVALIDRVVDIVEEGFDLAIRISRAGTADHAARKLATSRNILCASPDYLGRWEHPQTPADLARHRCIGYSYSATGDEWQLIDSNGKTHAVEVNCHMRTNNGDTARAAALAGQGVIWQPTFMIGDDLRAGRLVRVLPEFRLPDIDVLALYPSRRHVSAKVRAAIDFLVDAFAGVPPWDRA